MFVWFYLSFLHPFFSRGWPAKNSVSTTVNCANVKVSKKIIICSILFFVPAVFAAVCLTLHALHHRSLLQVYHSSDTLNDLAKLGFCVFVIGFALTAWFIFDGLYHKRGECRIIFNDLNELIHVHSRQFKLCEKGWLWKLLISSLFFSCCSQGMMPFQDSPYISAVWSFMTGKWGILLWSASRMYSSLISSGSLLGDWCENSHLDFLPCCSSGGCIELCTRSCMIICHKISSFFS